MVEKIVNDFGMCQTDLLIQKYLDSKNYLDKNHFLWKIFGNLNIS